jgi:phenylpropionate dioxygenase-like ring-hydroxylating dioxygenase large terminal subunit
MNEVSRNMICPGTQPYIRDQWYVIAFSHEVQAGQPFVRRCMDEPIVLFRDADGQVAALYDRCPHRAVPLSQGKVLNHAIECAYHGFQFDRTGRCVLIPTEQHVPRSVSTRSYPVVEQMQFVWIWMGDPAKADPALVPSYAQMGCDQTDDRRWQFEPYFVMEIKANYSLLFENLLDTSHISFLHIGGIDGGNMATAPYTVGTEGLTVTLERNLVRDVAVPGTAKLFSMPVGQVFSRRLRSQSFLPNLHLISNTIGFPDEPERKPNVRLNIMPITPASRSCLYQFVIIATSYPVNVTQDMKDQLWAVFSQDQDALEAIQAGYDELGPDLREISVKADAAAVSARRIIARMGQGAAPHGKATGPVPVAAAAASEARPSAAR